MRILYSDYAFTGAGWYVEVRRMKTRSLWEGPFRTRAIARGIRSIIYIERKERA